MFGTFFLLTQYLQGVLGYSPLGAAVRLLPISVVMMVVAPQTPKLVARFGADNVGTAGPRSSSPSARPARFADRHRVRRSWSVMIVMAAGMALTMTPMTTQLMAAVPLDRAGMGSATNDTTRELGGALGVAVLGSSLASQYTSGMADAVAGLPRRGAGGRRGQHRRRHGLVEQAWSRGRHRLLDVARSRSSTACAGRHVGAVVVVGRLRREALPAVGPCNPAVTGEPAPRSDARPPSPSAEAD